MLKVLSFFISLLCLDAAMAADRIGFSKGTEFLATPIQGEVSLTCEGFNGFGEIIFTCRDVVLDPSIYDFFRGPIEPSGNIVELTAFHQDGSNKSKTADYVGVEGITREPVNLWISTLFQKPLLEKGVNRVEYKISNMGGVLNKGSFDVEVKRGAARTCPSARMKSDDANDCYSEYSVCQRYFEKFKNCK